MRDASLLRGQFAEEGGPKIPWNMRFESMICRWLLFSGLMRKFMFSVFAFEFSLQILTLPMTLVDAL